MMKAVLQADQGRGPTLGFGFQFDNSDYGLECFGSPVELQEELLRLGKSVAEFMEHPATGIRARKVYKDRPELTFSGGPNTAAVLDVMAELDARDLAAAQVVAREHPELRRSDDPAVAMPLLSSLVAGDEAAVRVLAKEGIGLNVATQFGMTPLHWAVALGHAAIVQELLNAGADASRLSWFLVSPGELAALNGHKVVESRFRAKALTVGAPSARDVLERLRASRGVFSPQGLRPSR